jgi:hypothetical protein
MLMDWITRCQIDLHDTSVKLRFHDDQSLIVISSRERSVALDCCTAAERGEWLSALVSAKERDGVEREIDRESSGFMLSEEDSEDDSGETTTHSLDPDAGARLSVDDGGDGYNDILLALQDVRDSMIQCNLSMSATSDDFILTPEGFTSDRGGCRRYAVDISGEQMGPTSLQSICSFIETTDHGGRVILLHTGVLESAGIGMEDVLRALGERQRENPRLSSHSAPSVSQRKQYAAKFVRDMLFHPIYSKRPEVNSEAVQEVIDRYFPHCRLRRFSDDVEHIQEHKPTAPLPPSPPKTTEMAARTAMPVRAADASSNSSSLDTKSSLPSSSSWLGRRKKMRHHSFPNLLSLVGLVGSSTTAALSSSSASQAKSTRAREPAPCMPSDQENVAAPSTTVPSSFNASDLIELTPSELLPMESLRSLLWRFSCTELAEQFTLFHYRQVTRISLWDFLRSPRDAARELTEHFNRLVAFFVWSVLVEDTPKERAEIIEAVISIAHTASEPPLLNFHLVMICIGCLGDIPLMRSRLPVTWKKVRTKYKALLAELRKLCDHSGGFDKLKRRQSEETNKPALCSTASASSGSSFVPFIGVVGVALERLRTASYFTITKVLDLEKLERQYLALRVLETAMMRQPPSCHPRESSASSISNVDRDACSGANNRDASAFFQGFVMTMDVAFATPRLHNLRSQQILASECAPLVPSSANSRTASTFSLSPTRTAATVTSPLPSMPRSSLSFSSLSTGDAFNSSFLSFRFVCELLCSVPDARDRVNVALEALLIDERQPAAQFVRRFWLELKHNMSMRSAAVAMQGLRECVETLLRDVLTFKAVELMQLSGLDESSTDLRRMVYAKLLRLTSEPVFGWLVARVKLAKASEDATARLAIERRRQSQCKERATVVYLGFPNSPMDLLKQLVQMTKHAVAAIGSEEVDGNGKGANTEVEVLLDGLTRCDPDSLLCSHPATTALLLLHLLETQHLRAGEATTLSALSRTLSWLLTPATTSDQHPSSGPAAES